MIRGLASWKMILFELVLGGVAGGILLPSNPADAPTLNLVALTLLVIAFLLLVASFMAVVLTIASNAWRSGSLRNRPISTLDDPVLGHLEYDSGIWVSSPSDQTHDFMVTIDAPGEGPSDRQREFFRRIMKRRAEYEEQAKAFILAECGKLLVFVSASTLRLYSLAIEADSRLEDGRFVLEFVESDEIVVHRVEFRHHQPHEYGMDD